MKRRTDDPTHAIVIFFGAWSGVVLGKVTLSTPFSMLALISSGCKAACVSIDTLRDTPQDAP